MKKAFILFLPGLLLLSSRLSAKDIMIAGPEGNVVIPLKEIVRIGFEPQYIEVQTNQTSENFFYDQIREITFGENLSYVESIAPPVVSLYKKGNIISGPSLSGITIYDLTGKKLLNGAGSVDVSSLQRGVYVASSDGNTIKFTR